VCVCVLARERERHRKATMLLVLSFLSGGKKPDGAHSLSLPKFYGYFPTLDSGNVSKLKTSSVLIYMYFNVKDNKL